MTSSAGWAAAAHLVRSTGFGASGDLVDAVAAAGPSSWLETSLRAAPESDPGVAAAPVPSFETPAPLPQDASRDDRQKRRQHGDREDHPAGRVVDPSDGRRADPLVEKLTFGWHNHFATSATKVRSAAMLSAQNATLRAKGRGRSPTSPRRWSSTPALLLWLDGRADRKAPNENLSRELMELFTLGRAGGYTEQDVREGARALTGWTLDRQEGTARFVPRRHDATPKTVLGTTANLDATGFVHVLLDQPTSAPFVATRWWQLLAAPTAPAPDALGRMVARTGPTGTSPRSSRRC